jgi:hypothetical protein
MNMGTVPQRNVINVRNKSTRAMFNPNSYKNSSPYDMSGDLYKPYDIKNFDGNGLEDMRAYTPLESIANGLGTSSINTPVPVSQSIFGNAKAFLGGTDWEKMAGYGKQGLGLLKGISDLTTANRTRKNMKLSNDIMKYQLGMAKEDVKRNFQDPEIRNLANQGVSASEAVRRGRELGNARVPTALL